MSIRLTADRRNWKHTEPNDPSALSPRQPRVPHRENSSSNSDPKTKTFSHRFRPRGPLDFRAKSAGFKSAGFVGVGLIFRSCLRRLLFACFGRLWYPSVRGVKSMNGWHATYLGLKRLPRDLTAFEVEAFFTFSVAERRVIETARGPEVKLGLALQIGFLRLSGRLLDALRIVPAMLWRHLGEQFAAAAPDLASLRAMYRRRRTLFEHQELACETLGEFARRWLYEHQLIVLRERDLRTMIAKAIRSHEAALARGIHDAIDPLLLAQWRATITQPHDSGPTLQSWLWAAPAKHSTRQIEEVLERIEVLYRLGVDRHLIDVPDVILRRYARRLASRPPAVGARIADPARTIEVACFLRYCLLATTDHLLFMVRRRVAELWRLAGLGVEAALTDWVRMYQDLLVELGTLATDRDLSSDALREQLVALVEAHRRRKPRSRAEIVRDRLIEGVRPVHALLKALVRIPWRSTAAHPVLEAMSVLRDLYERDLRTLPATFAVPLGSVWHTVLAGKDRERAFATCEVATLLNLRRALRNGTVWIEHSLAFRSREKLFIPQERWRKARRAHYRRMSLPTDVGAFLEPLLERAAAGVRALADAAAAGVLQVDDELHLTPLAAEEEDPKLAKLAAALDRRLCEGQLRESILTVDAEVL